MASGKAAGKIALLKQRLQLHRDGAIGDGPLHTALVMADCRRDHMSLSGMVLEAAAVFYLFETTKGTDADAIELLTEYAAVPGFELLMTTALQQAYAR